MTTISARAVIRTHFIPCSNFRGARIKATCQAGSLTIEYPYELSGADCHWKAAKALIDKHELQWGDRFAVGQDDKGCYFTPVDTGYNVVEV